MQTVRHGPPTPMESPQAHDEIGNLIDTYNYMTEEIGLLMDSQKQAADILLQFWTENQSKSSDDTAGADRIYMQQNA